MATRSSARRRATATATSAVAALALSAPAAASAQEICKDPCSPLPNLGTDNAFLKIADLHSNGLLLPAVQKVRDNDYPGATNVLFPKVEIHR